jgi:hypothetical protein
MIRISLDVVSATARLRQWATFSELSQLRRVSGENQGAAEMEARSGYFDVPGSLPKPKRSGHVAREIKKLLRGSQTILTPGVKNARLWGDTKETRSRYFDVPGFSVSPNSVHDKVNLV